ncbi:MAG: hypothetical protein WDN66_04120 [Candidatus Saccharibacteria bacterium]
MTQGETPHISSEPLIQDGDFDNVFNPRLVDAIVPTYVDSLSRSVNDNVLEGKEQAVLEVAPMYDFGCMDTYVARMRVAHVFQDLGFETEEYYKPPEDDGNGNYGLTVYWGQEAESRKPKPHAPADVQSSISPLTHPRENYVPPEVEPNPVEMVVSDGSPEARAFKGLIIGRDRVTGKTVFSQG